MKSTQTQIREHIKNFILKIDYAFWLLFDFSKFKKIRKEKIRKVLVIHLGAMGEIIIASPLLKSLKENLNCEINFMVNKGKEDILKDNSYVSKILTYDNSFKLNLKKIKDQNFDLAVILYPGTTKIALQCFLAKIKYRIGCFPSATKGPILFFTKRVFPLQKKHAVQKNLDMIRQIRIDNKNPKIEFFVSKKDKENSEKKLKKIDVKKFVIIHPGFGDSINHKYPTRLWPLDRYSSVADYLIEKYGVKILLSGSEGEKKFSEAIKNNVKNKKEVIIVNDLFSLKEMAHIISKSKMIVGPSTGVTHIAEAFETPILELAGKGTIYKFKNKKDIYEWEPWIPKKKYRVLYHEEVCTGCDVMNCRKGTIECMNAINVEEVKNACDELLN